MHGHDDAERGVDVLELFARETETDIIHPGAAVVLRYRNAEQTQLPHATNDPVAIEPVLTIVFSNVRRNIPGRPLTNCLLEQAVLVGEIEIDHAGLRNRISRCLVLSRNWSPTFRPSNILMMSRFGSDDCRGRSAPYVRYR